MKLPTEVWRLATILGSNSPLRSRGVSRSTSPKSPRTVLAVEPLREFHRPGPWRRVCGSRVRFHLEFEEGFQGLLDEVLENILGIDEPRAAAYSDLVHQQLLEGFPGRR